MAAPHGTGSGLPWGWWLRVRGGVIEDAQGRHWGSVRQAFWEGHLGFPGVHLAREQLELLLRVLMGVERRWVSAAETRHDLFCGDTSHWTFYNCWLSSIGLLEPDAYGWGSADLSDLGRSVLLMLQATREPEWVDLPFGSVLEAVRQADRTAADDERERALRAFENGITRLPRLFARETAHGRHMVTLTGLDTVARMPLRRVVWSLTFPDTRVRDDFFAWLADRVHRWEDWGELAFSRGADALTQHLLGLLAVGMAR